MYYCGPLHMDVQKQDDHLETTCSSTVLILGVAMRTNRKQWTIERCSKREPGILILIAWHDDDDDDDFYLLQIICKHISLADRWNPNRYYLTLEVKMELGEMISASLHFQEFLKWSLTTKCCLMAYPDIFWVRGSVFSLF